MIQRDIEYSGQFSKDVKLAQKRHKDMNKLKYLMTLLINNALPKERRVSSSSLKS